MNEQWFTAKCRYSSVHTGDEPSRKQLLEYRYFLIRGLDEADATTKARSLAEKRQHSYRNQFGATVHWKLERVIDVKQIFDFQLEEGLEIYHEYVGADSVL